LGRLEELSVQLAGIIGNAQPKIKEKAVIVMAADHGVAREGVSAYPPEVTPQMVLNFLRGGAAINVLSRQAGARIVVVDIGVAFDFQGVSGLLHRKISYGTQNLSRQAAMSLEQCEEAIQTGIDIVAFEKERGLDLVATGDMGIGNTTPSAAIVSVLCRVDPELVTGRGTGVDDSGLQLKINAIRRGIDANDPDPHDPIDVLRKVGGFEIAGLVGVILGAANLKIPVVIDGFISGAAALVAGKLCPASTQYMIASHQSVEIGHQVLLRELGLKPLFNMDMRLGEGTGAVLAFHFVEAASRILSEMATFDEAGVSGKG